MLTQGLQTADFKLVAPPILVWFLPSHWSSSFTRLLVIATGTTSLGGQPETEGQTVGEKELRRKRFVHKCKPKLHYFESHIEIFK